MKRCGLFFLSICPLMSTVQVRCPYTDSLVVGDDPFSGGDDGGSSKTSRLRGEDTGISETELFSKKSPYGDSGFGVDRYATPGLSSTGRSLRPGSTGTMSRAQLTAELGVLVGNVVGMLTKLMFQGIQAAAADSSFLKSAKVEAVGDMLGGMSRLAEMVGKIQAEQLVRDKSGAVMTRRVTVTKNKEKVTEERPVYRFKLRLDCLSKKSKDRKTAQLCKASLCESKGDCVKALMRDLVGYTDPVTKVKRHGIVNEMLKVMFTGYKVDGKRKPSMFETLGDITQLKPEIKQQVVDTMRNIKRILKLLAQLTFTESEGDVSGVLAQQKKQGQGAKSRKEARVLEPW